MAARFRLATLLKVRLDRRDALRDELAQALQAGRILRERVETVDRSREGLEGELRVASIGEVNVDSLIEARRYGLVLRLERAELLRQIAIVDEETERRLAALVEADREVRTLERMEENFIEQQRVVQARLDQSRLDELGSVGHFRRRAEEGER